MGLEIHAKTDYYCFAYTVSWHGFKSCDEKTNNHNLVGQRMLLSRHKKVCIFWVSSSDTHKNELFIKSLIKSFLNCLNY